MTVINARDILPFPGGDNSTDTIIEGIHFNQTALTFNNYTLYSNGTLSNGTNCFLTFPPYTPALLYQNGTFLNTTSCYTPLKPMGDRAKVGMAFAVFFGLTLVFTFVNLRKHGRLFLPSQKRFRAIGRRWQWYWMIWVAACGMASGFTSVDVDRYYLPEWPLMLNVIMWYMAIPSTLAVVWESVRHWASWEERQLIDPNPFSLPQDDKRGKTEFYMPLAFYGFGFMSFFMSVPRNWKPMAMQRSQDQTAQIARPAAQDGRFKSSAFFLFFAWLTILYSMRHSIHHYKPRNRGVFNSIIGGIKQCPQRFLLTIPLAGVIVAYQFMIYWVWDVSPLNQEGDVAFIYGLGWAPIAAILIIHEIAGYILPNEDRELIRQRRIRGQEIDAEMGYTKKPHWWRLLNGEQNLSVSEALAKRAREVGGRLVGSMTAEQVAEQRRREEESGMGVELNNMSGRRKRNEDREIPAYNLTPAQKASARMEERRRKEAADEQLRRAALALFPPQERQTPQRKQSDTDYLMSDEFMDHARRSSKPDPAGAAGAGAGAGLSPTVASESRGTGIAGTRSSLPSGLRPQERQESSATGTTAGARTSQTSLASTLNQPAQSVRSMLDI